MSAKLSAAAAALQALSNPARLAILAAIAERNQRRVPVVLEELGDLRTVAKEVGRLTEAGLLTKVRGQFIADLTPLGALADAVAEATALGRAIPPDSPLRRYLVHGRIEALPKRPADLAAMAAVLCTLLPNDRTLTEAEVNDCLAKAGDDVAGLRRLLVDLHFVRRSGSADYEVIEHPIHV